MFTQGTTVRVLGKSSDCPCRQGAAGSPVPHFIRYKSRENGILDVVILMLVYKNIKKGIYLSRYGV